jgi:hypothetical protein
MTMTKLCLDVEELTEDFFDDTCLLGITSTVKNYRFCWCINQSLNYQFRLNRDIEIQLRRRERSYYFRVYEHQVRHSQLSHYLYQNYNDGEYLLPEFRHMDFLWLMKGEFIETSTCYELMQDIKSLNGVQLVAELTNEKIRNKGHLIF